MRIFFKTHGSVECTERDRAHVYSKFFQSAQFKGKGSLVYKMYKIINPTIVGNLPK